MRKVFLVLLSTIILSSMLFAAPARPGFRQFTQPDGSYVTLELKGDEHFHFARDMENYSVVRDAEGWWTYAQKVDGLLVPSFFIVGKDKCPFEKGLKPEVDAVAALPVNEFRQINWKKFADIDIYSKDGRADRRVLIALGAFDDSTYFGTDIPNNPDTEHWGVANGFTSAAFPGGTAHDSVYWDSVFFSDSEASFKAYYAELSFGTWIAEGHVLGPVSSGDTYGRYGDGRELTYMQDIENALGGRMQLYGSNGSDFDNSGSVTYADFDGDGDGYVDHFCVVRCGGEQSSTGDPADMWATKYTTTISTSWSTTILNPVNAGELTEQDITRDPNLDTLFVRSRTMGIGVHAHESFHAFGAPDLYDYGYTSTTAGDWSLMDGGSWTSDGVQPGSRPAHPGGMLQYDIPGAPEDDTPDGFFSAGWRQEISTNGRYPIVGLGLPPSYGGPRLYLIQNSNFVTEGEHFLVENRCNTGVFEGNLPEFGIIISHYDPSEKGSRYNEGPGTETYYTYWVEQDGFDPQIHVDFPQDTIYRNVSSAAYRAGESDYFDNTTSAGSNSNDLSSDGPHIISISAPGDTMWFTLDNCTAPGTPSFGMINMTVMDNIAGYGDNDGIADPDEMFDLSILIKNVGANGSGITGVLTNIDGKATVNDANGSWSNINNGATGENTADPFRVKLNPGYGPGEYVKFNLAVSCNEGSTTNIEIALLINEPNVTDHFYADDEISGDLADPSGIDVMYHPSFGWFMLMSGTGLGTVTGETGANRIYMFDLATMGANLTDFMGVVGSSYVCGIDHDSNMYMWYTNADEMYCFDISAGLTGATEVGRLNLFNSDWGGTPMKRYRGVTFDNVDSMYGYWHVYDPSFVESLYGITKNLGGNASQFASWPLLDGESYGGYWNNGRGIEFDGTSFWSINIFIPTMYRRDPATFLSFYQTPIPSAFGSYPSYDIAWQAMGPAGDDQVEPFKPGNRYFMWTVNMDNAEVYQVEMTSIVLPSAVDIDLTASTFGGNQTDLVWHPNASTDFVTKYIVYRSSDPNFYASSTDSIGVTTDTTFTDFPPISKATDFYYKVRAVNYHGYSESTSFDYFEANFTGTQTVNLTAMQIDRDVVLTWRPENSNGIKWNVLRKSPNGNYENIGTVDINKEEMLSEYKFVDNTIAQNGIYNYKLELISSDGDKISFNEIAFKYFNNLIFGIRPVNENPMRGDIVLSYGIDRNADVSLKIYSITGQLVSTPVSGNTNAGSYSIRINTDNMPAGTYFAVLKQGDRQSKEKITLIK